MQRVGGAYLRGRAGKGGADVRYAMETEALFDFSHTVMGDFLKKCRYPWQALPQIGAWIVQVGGTLSPSDYERVGEGVWIARSAVIAPTAQIVGPCIIGHETEVRHCAFVRGNAVVGAGCVVGNSTELKNAILLDGVQVPHFNYVGDSILGYRAHLGAGAVTSNVKSDKSTVCVRVGAQRVETGLKKLGAMVGDGVEVGCGCVLNPGTVIGRGSRVYPLCAVRGAVPQGCICKGEGVFARIG